MKGAPNLRQKALTGLMLVSAVLIVLLLVSILIGSSQTMPENAVVVIGD